MRDFLTWAWKDFRDDLDRLDSAKLMLGFILFPVCLGVAYEIRFALGIAH